MNIATALSYIQSARQSYPGNITMMAAMDEKERRIRAMWPSGSGLDAGFSNLEFGPRKISFDTSFHHMDDNGSYDGWSDHHIKVEPEFGGFVVTVGGRNKNDIKDYLCEVFHTFFNTDFDWMGK